MDITKKFQKAIEAAGKLNRGVVTHIEAKHDDDCPAIKTQNLTDCTCNPDFQVMKPDAQGQRGKG